MSHYLIIRVSGAVFCALALYNLSPEYDNFVSTMTQAFRNDSRVCNKHHILASLIDESSGHTLNNGPSKVMATASKLYKRKAIFCRECKKTSHNADETAEGVESQHSTILEVD